MNRIRHITRLAAALAGLALTWLGLAAAAPAVFAQNYPLPVNHGAGGSTNPPPPGGGPPSISVLHATAGWNKHPPLPVQVHTVIVGGMPGWQIALIAAGAALVAAAAAVLAYRARATRRPAVTATA